MKSLFLKSGGIKLFVCRLFILVRRAELRKVVLWLNGYVREIPFLIVWLIGVDVYLQVIRRSGPEEKMLVVCRQRPGHRCANAVIVVIILLWDGVARPLADFAYANIANYVPKHGEPTERRCATNEE